MLKLFKIRGYRNWLTTWYVGFFTIVIFALTAIIYIRIDEQTWSNFDYSVSQLGEEMLDEIFELRDNLDLNDFEPLVLTETSRQKFIFDANQELKEETFDNQLPELSYVKFYEIASGQQNLIYQSPEINKFDVKFIQPAEEYWGYRPFTSLVKDNQTLHGIGYAGVRDFSHYFVGFVFDSKTSLNDKIQVESAKSTVYSLIESIDRQGDSLVINRPMRLYTMINKLKGWIYIYFYEDDYILWSSREVSKSEIYIPSEDTDSDIVMLPRLMESKEHFFEIQDKNGRNYRQYTIVSDINPDYIHRVDLAVPSGSIRNELNFLALNLILADLVLVCIVWAGGWILMRRALRPVNEVITAVNEITTKNLSKRLPLPKVDLQIVELVQTFNELLDRLAESFETQKSFIADASHELRTPLSILIAEIETAAKNDQDQSVLSSSLSNAILEIERMARIVDDLHLLAIKDAGRKILNKEKIRLDELLFSTISRCQVFAKKKDIKINIDKLEIVEYEGDEELLLRATSNIVNNAIKYSEAGEEIKISLKKIKDHAVFSVSDQGIGISPDDEQKIFDRFYRVDSSRSRDTGGSGLGLAISKWIIEMHHGTIEVRSAPGKGSTFNIILNI